MVRRSRVACLLKAPVLLLALLVGCSGKGEDDDGTPIRDTPRGSKGGPSNLTAIKGAGTTTLKGRVTLSGGDLDYPELAKKFQAGINKDREHCLKGEGEEIADPGWIVDPGSRGVKNVFVWLRPEDDKTQFFDVKQLVDDRKFEQQVELDQPHCAFKPHAVVLFPRYIDPEKKLNNFKIAPPTGPPSTGQKFIVKNSAPIAHNTAWGGDEAIGGNQTLAGSDGKTINQLPLSDNVVDIKPSYRTGVKLSCSVHPWMKAYVWAFPHPFAAVTNEKGEYRIDNVPAGVNLRLVAWHEAAPRNWVLGSDQGKVVKLAEKEHTENLEVNSK